MLDDGFGSVVAQRLEGREMPSGVKVMDAGSGGLDLAYEIMRGYHALVLVDVSRQGGEPGTLYLIEPDLRRSRRRSRTARRSTRTAWTRRRCCGSCARSAAGRARS